MLQRNKSNRTQRTRRCSDDDSSQSSTNGVAPVFASVHRPRHNSGIVSRAIAIATTAPPSSAGIQGQAHHHHHPQQQRQSYHQYQQQRRLQQQQQQHQKQKPQQQLQQQQLQPQPQQFYQPQFENIGNATTQKSIQKSKHVEHEQQHHHHHQKQQQRQQQALVGTSSVKQSVAVAIPQAPVLAAATLQQSTRQLQATNNPHVVLYDGSPTKVIRQQQQPQQQQQQQPPQNFNHISKTATNLLNDIYEKHLLSQTTFKESEQQLQLQQQHVRYGVGPVSRQVHPQQQQQIQVRSSPHSQFQPAHHTQQRQPHQQRPALHFLKLPPPPAPPPHAQASTTVANGYAYQHHFQFSDTFVEPTSKKLHFLLESQQPSSPPTPPAPINHVYETIKERPLRPPPPPERKKLEPTNEAPPLPPSRQFKKRLQTATSGTSGRTQKSGGSSSKKTVAPTLLTDGVITQKKTDGKLVPAQAPSYVAPSVGELSFGNQQKQQPQQQYNPQQRTKADGEQKSYVYQQLREQQHHQAQHTKLRPAALQQQQQQHKHQQLSDFQEKQKLSIASCSGNIREHPLGGEQSIATKSQHHIGASAVEPNSIPTAMETAAAAAITLPCHLNMSVEQTLQHAGLLQPSSSSMAAVTAAASLTGNNIINNNNNNRPCALPIVFEEDTGEFQDVLVLEDGTAKLQYRHGKIEVRMETAQAMAAAAYYARAAQKLAQSGSTRTRTTTEMPNTTARNGGFCGALQRAPPPVPPGLARRLANKENYGIGKVKVMLRVADNHGDIENPHFMSVDKKKRQVTLTDPTAASSVAASTSQERGPMVAAPKMFAFDSLFTTDDQQSDVCSSALSEVIPAVLEGSDGCLLTIGYPNSGQSKTMLGGVNPPSELGAIPCAISWLYKGINERRQKSGARFSVRVSALGVSATKPDSSSKDLLAAHATESDDSPGVYLRDDFLGGPTELRAPTAERAALFLDAALAGRPQGGLEPAMIFTLHVYQYSLSRKGGVAGGRSRLHLIDLGGCANRNGGLPLSGIGNILLAILSGQRHPPNKDHPLTPLLKDCLAPLTCHVAIMAHVTHTQSHTDALTTIQLASRIHRLRRRKHRFPMPSDKVAGAGLTVGAINGGHQSTGSSAGSGADPSSSELSADTVIYMGPSDDATDGEHPPVYLPSLSSGDNRGVMSKALKGSGLENKQPSMSKIPAAKKVAVATPKAPLSPVTTSRTGSLKRGHANSPTPPQLQPSQSTTVTETQQQQQFYSPVHSVKTLPHSASSPKIVAGSLRHPGMTMMCSKGSNVPSPKGSPLRRPGVGAGAAINSAAGEQTDCPSSPMRKITEEQWIDGPRVSRAKVAEARHLLREVNHVKQCETWIDGPKSQSSRSLTAGNLPTASSQVQGYGFMDSHKKTMIRQWVENQTSQVFQTTSAASSPTHAHNRDTQAQHLRNITFHMSQLKQKSLDAPEDLYATSTRQQLHQQLQQQQPPDQQSLRSSQLELINPIGGGLTTGLSSTNASAPAEIRDSTLYRHSATAQLTNPPPTSSYNAATLKDETDLLSTHSLHSGYGSIAAAAIVAAFTSVSETGAQHCDRQPPIDCDEDQDSGPSEVPPALPLIEPLGSREISHESLHRILSRHVSRESLYQQQQQELRRQEDLTQHNSPSRHSSHHYSQHSIAMSDCGLQVTEEEIARTMGSEHPLAALSHCDNMSIISSFNMAGDAFSDCAMGERTRNQFDQLARLREIFTSQLAMAEVTPVFRTGCDVGSVYSEPAYRFNTGPGSVCSEPPYRPPSPRQPSRSPSQGSLPSLTGIMQIAGMEQYASLRHPDGASDPNLPKVEKPFVMEQDDICEVDEKAALLSASSSKRPSLEQEVEASELNHLPGAPLPMTTQTQLPLLPLNTSSEAYDSGHDSSTPRTSKHSGISRRAESGYHSVATARDSDESSFTSGLSKEHHNRIILKKKRQDKGLCNWLMNPFTCTYPETEGEISDF